MRSFRITKFALLALVFGGMAEAAVLPDDRADIFYSQYKGGGMDITGKSILVRKKFAETFAVQANYFVDTVSGASVDVLSNASVIKDERKQKSIDLTYIRGKTQYDVSYTNSKEDDYLSDTAHFALSQDMFGDLTTITLGFTRSFDTVGMHNQPSFKQRADRRGYEAAISQIITKDLITALSFEVITDEGYLNNPYRFNRYLDPTAGRGWSQEPEVYPRTRTSDAVAFRAKYYLWYRASASGTYRFFRDTWGIRSNTYELGYTHPIDNRWILEGRLRLYNQSRANFYSDLFPNAGFQNFVGRDKDLAASHNTTIGAKVTYAILPEGWKMFKRGTLTGDVSRIQFKYDDFRDIKDYGLPAYAPGHEPLYQFNATVYQIYASFFF